MRSTFSFAVAFALLAMLLGGCQSNSTPKEAEAKPKPDWEWDGFAPSETSHTVADIAHAQAVTGARAEATLRSYHFDDAGHLNSLGIDRLEMIFEDPNQTPPTLYMAWPADDAKMSARRASIEQWMKDAGIEAGAVALKDGANPGESGPAAPSLARMWKTENPQHGTAASGGGGDAGVDTGGMTPQGFQPGATGP